MYDTLSSEEVHLIKTSAAFAAGEIEPYATDWELQRRVPTETFQSSGREEKVSNGWRLNGEKAWVTNSVCADVFAVYAQTNPDSGWRGIACFLVDGNVQGLERGVPYTMSRGTRWECRGCD